MKQKDGSPPHWHMNAEYSTHTNRELDRPSLEILPGYLQTYDTVTVRAGLR
jgi:hypothetical protein